MGEGFPLWSLASMAWEGREPLRDWICLSVSLCFCVLFWLCFTVSCIYGDRNSDWPETFAVIFFPNISFLAAKEERQPPYGGLTRVGARPKGGPASWPPRALVRVDFPSKFSIFSKNNLRPFLSRLDSVWYGYSAKHKTCNRQELALGTGSIC